MNLNGDVRTKSFVTNVGLVTSNGAFGYNIMACEWTHQISHDPALIAVAIRPHKATFSNIQETKYFGVCIAAEDQNELSSVAGNSSGKSVNKIEVLKELGYEFYKAEMIDVWLVKNTCMNAECKLVEGLDIGDHPLLIGEVVKVESYEKDPVLYHQGKYWEVGNQILKSGQERLDKIDALVEKWKKS